MLASMRFFYCVVEAMTVACLSSFKSICSCGGRNCTTMSEKNKVVTLNLETRLKVIEDASNGLSQRKLAEKYKCGKTQIQKILKEKVAIRERWMKIANENQKRETYGHYNEVNELALAWVEGARARNIPISDQILQKKVAEIKKEEEVEVDVVNLKEEIIAETYNTNIELIQVSNQELEEVEIPLAVNRKKSCEDPFPNDEAYNILTNASTTQRDECDIYGEYVAVKLRKLDARAQSIVQQHINNILFEADMGKYNTLQLPT